MAAHGVCRLRELPFGERLPGGFSSYVPSRDDRFRFGCRCAARLRVFAQTSPSTTALDQRFLRRGQGHRDVRYRQERLDQRGRARSMSWPEGRAGQDRRQRRWEDHRREDRCTNPTVAGPGDRKDAVLLHRLAERPAAGGRRGEIRARELPRRQHQDRLGQDEQSRPRRSASRPRVAPTRPAWPSASTASRSPSPATTSRRSTTPQRSSAKKSPWIRPAFAKALSSICNTESGVAQSNAALVTDPPIPVLPPDRPPAW